MKPGRIAARASIALAMLSWGIEAAPQTVPAQATGDGSCRAIPYQVGNAVQGVEVAAKFGAGALAKLAKAPDLSARAGAEVLKTAYAGINGQAMSEVFDALGCRVKAYIKDTDVDAEKKRAAVTLAIAQLNGEMAYIQSAYASGFDAVGALRQLYLNAARTDTSPVLTSAITTDALKSVDTEKLFISVETRKFWAGLDVGTNIGVHACGGVVKAAISDGGSALQVSLAATRDILINYLDPNVPPVVALSKLMLASVPPTFKPTPVVATSFKDCSKDLAQAAAAAASSAASAPVTSSAPAASAGSSSAGR